VETPHPPPEGKEEFPNTNQSLHPKRRSFIRAFEGMKRGCFLTSHPGPWKYSLLSQFRVAIFLLCENLIVAMKRAVFLTIPLSFWKQQCIAGKIRCFSLFCFAPLTIYKCTLYEGVFIYFSPSFRARFQTLFLGPMIYPETCICSKAHSWSYIRDRPYCSEGGSSFFWNVGIRL
jgi:hypothetical protein